MKRFEAIELAHATRKEILRLVRGKPSIVNPYSLANGCAITSWVFYSTLRKLGVRTVLVSGTAYGTPHFWVRCSKTIWDLTHTQFEQLPLIFTTNLGNPKYIEMAQTRESLREFKFHRHGYHKRLDSIVQRLYKSFKPASPKGTRP